MTNLIRHRNIHKNIIRLLYTNVNIFMNKLLIICGPTATGKTGLGLKLAKKFGGEIISADSRQVYLGMDVVTGKDLPTNSKLEIRNYKLKIKDKKYNIGFRLKEGIPIWLVDVCRPDQDFSVSHFVKFANKVMGNIRKRGKLPIVVGGTGLYIKALTEKIETIDVRPDLALRRDLADRTVKELQQILKKLWPSKFQAMNKSDINNPRRLTRAIEIAHKLKKTNDLMVSLNKDSKQNLDVHIIGLTAGNKFLCNKIQTRIKDRIKRGAVTETKKLIKKYGLNNQIIASTLGYKQLIMYCLGKVSFEKMINSWQLAEQSYAKRQVTWFNKEKQICWFEAAPENYLKIEKDVSLWYDKQNAEES